jgi:hypothetical protein
MQRSRTRPAPIGLALLLGLGASLPSANAQEGDVSRVGQPARRSDTEDRGEMALTYQYQRAEDLVSEDFTIDSAPITTHLVDFAVSYRINERWTLNAGLPFISREWKGGPSHNPLNIVPPQLDSEFVDDNHFHGFLQDLRLGAAYLLLEQPVSLAAHLEYGIPASDYPFFAASAVGRNLQTIEVGATAAYRPPFLPWYFSLRTGYVMTDAVLGVDTDAMRVTADATRFMNERIALNVFLTSKNGKGISPPQTPDFSSELWYRHDQIIRHNYANVGVGVNWALGDRNMLNFTVLKMVHVEDVFELRDALSVTLSRPF